MSNSLALRFATTMGHYLIKMWNPSENIFSWKITIQSSLGCHIGEPLLLDFRTVIRTLSFGTRYAMGIPRRRIRWGGPLRIFQNPSEEHVNFEESTAKWPMEWHGWDHNEKYRDLQQLKIWERTGTGALTACEQEQLLRIKVFFSIISPKPLPRYFCCRFLKIVCSLGRLKDLRGISSGIFRRALSYDFSFSFIPLNWYWIVTGSGCLFVSWHGGASPVSNCKLGTQ